MKRILFLLAFFTFFAANAQHSVSARGQVVYFNKYVNSYYPLPKSRVDILRLNRFTHHWEVVAATSTDIDGFYYFKVPPGNYTLRVNEKKEYTIRVRIPETKSPYFDIPRVLF